MSTVVAGARKGFGVFLALVCAWGGWSTALLQAGSESGPPLVDAFDPPAGQPGDTINVFGANFSDAGGVLFNGSKSGFQVVSDKHLIATVPPDATSGPITVVNPAGQGASNANFEVSPVQAPPPIINSVKPTSGQAGDQVFLVGSFLNGAFAVLFNGVKADFSVTSENEIVASVPAGSSSGPITVATPSGTTSTKEPFNVVIPPPAPVVTGFKPSSGKEGDSFTVQGQYFTGTLSVTLGGIAAGFQVLSDNDIQATVPSGAKNGPIAVTTTAGTGTSAGVFEIVTAPPPMPIIKGFQPASGKEGDSFIVLGQHFAGLTSVRLGDVAANFGIVSDQELKVEVPVGAKSAPVILTGPGGTVQSTEIFEVVRPTLGPAIVAINPPSGKPGDRVTILVENVKKVRGVSFGPFGASYEFVPTTFIEATVPSEARTSPVIVLTSDGAIQSSFDFMVDVPILAPTIAAFDPVSGPVGTAVSITGTHLATVDQVLFDGASAGFVVASDSRIVAKVPPGASSGPIMALSKAGTAKSAASFSVVDPPAIPTIAQFKPGRGPVGTTIDVVGENLTGVATVTLGGAPAAFAALSPTTLRLTVPEAASSGMIIVETASGTASSTEDFIVERAVPAPLVDRFSSWRGVPGEVIKIRGTGLHQARRVFINGLPADFSIVRDGELAVAIPQDASSGEVVIETDAGRAVSPSALVVARSTDPLPAPPQLRPPGPGTAPAGQVRFEFPTQPHQSYVVEHASNLGSAAASGWRQVDTQSPRSVAGVAAIEDSAENAAGYYRVIAGIAGFDNWDFESGLFGWQATGDAFEDQPTFGEAYTRAALGAGEILRNIGGDYWDTPVSLGHHGDYWVGTAQSRPESEIPLLEDPARLDARTGTLISPIFRIERPFISFLIGGNQRQALPPVDAPRVELLVRPRDADERTSYRARYPESTGEFHVVDRAFVPGYRPELMRREVLAVSAFAGRQARLRIVDPTRVAHINVDDFRFPERDPRPGLIAVPRIVAYLNPTEPAESQPEPRPEPTGAVHLDPDAPVWGFADTHTHPASNLGFGGKLIHGHASGPPGVSLSSCEEHHGWNGANVCFPAVICAPAMLMAQFAGAWGHRTGGYEYGFDGWPNVLEQGVHQQMYVEWIRRAWQGGLRLMVAHAVHNRLLADLNFNDGLPRNDISVVQRQIDAIRAMVARHAFMEIALTPRRAREIIHSGKLAVVLGIEVDRPFLNDDDRDISDARVAESVRHAYENLGIRHMFPVHFADNPYGGFAMYNSLWIYNSWWVDHQRYPEAISPLTRGFTDPIEWRFEAEGGLQVGAFFLGVAAFPPAPSHYPAGGQINARGLQPAGRVLIREMMRRGMLVDVDHMSLVMKREVFDIAQTQRYPLISGHCGFTELSLHGAETSEMGKRPAESDLTPTFARELAALGGMVAPITLAKDVRAHGTKVANDAPGSSKSWAQLYLRAVDYFGGRNVGLGTDYGLIHGSGPRFGMKAMFVLKDDDARRSLRSTFLNSQANGVRYADPLRDYRESRFQGPNEGSVYDGEEKEFWEAIALHKSGRDPDLADRPRVRNDKIKHLARGLFAESESHLASILTRPLPLIRGDSEHEIRAAFYVRHSATRALPDTVDRRVREIYNKMLPIWRRWSAMEGNNRPLRRSTMNAVLDADPNKPYVKEWDINLDGLAHYGLLPDFIQDTKNSGLDRHDLRPLFRSAEDYIRLWERCEQNRVRD